MDRTLPKGHLSCLSESFRYTPASGTNIAKTFAKIKRRLNQEQPEHTPNVCVLPARKAGQK